MTNGVTTQEADGSLAPLVYEAGAKALFAAMEADGVPMPERRKYLANRFFKRCASSLAKLKAAGGGIYVTPGLASHAEAADRYNWLNPTGAKLTTMGAPKPAALGWTFPTVADVFDTGIPLSSLRKDGAFMAVYNAAGFSVQTTAMAGAQDGAAGMILMPQYVSGEPRSRCMSALNAAVTLLPNRKASSFNGVNFTAVNRRDISTAYYYHHGQVIASSAQAGIASTSSNTIKFGGDGVTKTNSTLSALIVGGVGLADNEIKTLNAALKTYLEGVYWGEPLITDAGVGPAVVDADLLVYGLGNPAIAAAVEGRRQGLAVVLVGDWQDRSVDWIGGMPAAGGLAFIDVKILPTVSGAFRTMIQWANLEYYGNANTESEQGLSLETKGWNLAARRFLDPNRSSANLTGLDIPVYFSEGLESVQKTGGGKISSIRTADGRTFTGRQFCFADYEGAAIPLIPGLSYVSGTEAAGAGIEAYNGFRGVAGLALPSNATSSASATATYRIDPYVTPGVPSSGLLPEITAMPSILPGDPDPGAQSMCTRVSASDSPTRWADLFYTVPAGYSPARYERFGRLFAVAPDYSIKSLFKIDNLVNTAAYDINNGAGGWGIDLPQSGDRWNAAKSNAEKQAVIDDINAYDLGLFYWLLNSGDSRIPASLVKALGRYSADATMHLDPGDGLPINFPPRKYVREAAHRIRSSSLFNGNDTAMPEDSAPRISDHTVTMVSYRVDIHLKRVVAYDDSGGPAIFQQGGAYPLQQANLNAPIPMEVMFPAASEVVNATFPTAPAITATAYAEYRMEACMSLAGQSCGVMHAKAMQGGTSLQNVDYAAVRSAMLATPDPVKPLLLQSNGPAAETHRAWLKRELQRLRVLL